MQLEVGKTYGDEGGEEYEIVAARNGIFIGYMQMANFYADCTQTYDKSGLWLEEGGASNNLIKEVKPKIKGWVNIYEGRAVGPVYKTKKDANNALAISSRTACIQIEFEEGEGLDAKTN